jgi:hypothetical protein
MEPLVFKKSGGIGNLFIQLASMEPSCKLLHDDVYEYELANCLTIHGFTRVSYEGKQPDAPIFINPYTIQNVHPKIRDIIRPSPHIENLIHDNLHILDGVSHGMSIRRGSYCEDSRQFKDERSDRPEHFFCSDDGLEKFKKIIEGAPGKVFVSSDSASTLKELIGVFGDKIRTIDTACVYIQEQREEENINIEKYHSVFVKFFLLSKCPHLFLTGGKTDFTGFSTFAYMAAIYGGKPFSIVFNQ